MNFPRRVLTCLMLIGLSGFTFAQTTPTMKSFRLDGRKLETGQLLLPHPMFIVAGYLNLPKGWRFIRFKDDAALKDPGYFGKGSQIVAMLFPPKIDPKVLIKDNTGFLMQEYAAAMTARGFETWPSGSRVIFVTIDNLGFIDEQEGAGFNPDRLLENAKRAVEADNKQLVALGFPAATLTGWFVPPRWNQGAHAVVWTRELEFASGKKLMTSEARILTSSGYIGFHGFARPEAIGELLGDFDTLRQNLKNADRYDSMGMIGLGQSSRNARRNLTDLIVGQAPVEAVSARSWYLQPRSWIAALVVAGLAFRFWMRRMMTL
jgi:hypothetical protein